MTFKKKYDEPDVQSNTIAELSSRLLEANNELKKAEADRKNMLENISHDLRAPLTAIRNTIDYLKQLDNSKESCIDPKDLTSYLNILDTRTRTLEVMVQDLYFFTRVDSGMEKMKMEDIPLGQFLEEYFFAAEVNERYNDRVLSLNIPKDYSACVMMDASKMSRVLDNLFVNALKYSDSGASIELGAYAENDMAFFYVKDTGEGIPEDAIEHIFDRTYRVSDSRTPETYNSSGLGLSIVRSIIDKHGGEICCVSKVGEGSCFTVKLPLNE